MWNLVKKDLIIGRNTGIILFCFLLLLLPIIQRLTVLLGLFYVLAIMLFVYLVITMISVQEQKNQIAIILNSLPLRREDIIKGKYISVIVLTLLGGGLIVSTTNFYAFIGYPFQVRTANLWDVGIALGISLIIYGLYYPIYYKLIGGDGKFINTLLYLVFLMIPLVVSRLARKYYDAVFVRKILGLEIQKVTIVTLGFGILIFFLSFHASKLIYEKQNL